MGFTPEQYRRIAETYDLAAADYTMPPAQRTAYAHKAEWYRMLARLGAKPKWATPATNIVELTSCCVKEPETALSYLSAAARMLWAMLAAMRRAS
jgi:hypothetical protein